MWWGKGNIPALLVGMFWELCVSCGILRAMLQKVCYKVVNLLLFQYSFLLIMKTYSPGSDVRSSASLRESLAVSMTLGSNASLNLIDDA